MAASAPTPAVILQNPCGVYDVNFATSDLLLSGGIDGTVCLWKLSDRRPAVTWAAASGSSVLSVQSYDKGSECLVQSKNGSLELWDVQASTRLWAAETGASSFARAKVMLASNGDAAQSQSSGTCVCSPTSEPDVVGVFDVRGHGRRCELKLETSAFEKTTALHGRENNSAAAGMCTGLYPVPALGPWHLMTLYESTDVALWDLRKSSKPMGPSVLAGNPISPAICGAVMWKQVWVASSDGSVNALRITSSGDIRPSKTLVEMTPTPITASSSAPESGSDMWQSESGGINMIAVRPDLRLAVAARWDKRVEMIDVKTARSIGRLRCHDSGVLGIAFDSDRGTFATAGEEGRIALWGVLAETYQRPPQNP